MKGKIEKGKLREILIETWKEYISILTYSVVGNLDKVSIIIQIIIPVLMVYCLGNANAFLIVLFACISAFICRYVNTIGHKVRRESEDGFPLPDKRFTSIDDRGLIWIERNEESIQYLYSVEEYLQSHGFLNGSE